LYDAPQIFFTPPTTGTAVLTAVPEPDAWVMLLLGLALAGIACRIAAPSRGIEVRTTSRAS
jgi:hypothetical protein